jgi:uncharacterized membrane protein
MTDIALPFWLAAIVAGTGTVGAILLAAPAIDSAARQGNRHTFMMLAGLGIFHFLMTFLLTVVPLSLVAIFRSRRPLFISLSIFLVLYLILGVLMALFPQA